MKPALKGLSSPDLPDGVSLPPDPSDCWIIITASIGTAEDDSADNFTLYVCTPSKLAHILTTDPYLWGRHVLVVDAFDWQSVEDAVNTMCSGITGETWAEVAEKLNRYAAWEFEDYEIA